MSFPNISSMYEWLNNFFPAVSGGSRDYLHLKRQSDGAILGWIDENGVPQGSLAVSGGNLPPIVISGSSPTFDVDFLDYPVVTFQYTLTGNVSSSTLENTFPGQIIILQLVQNATGGYTFAYPSNILGGMGISTSPNAINTQAFIVVGSNAYALAPGTIN